MNFSITGKKITSTVPQKKTPIVQKKNQKPKQSLIIKPVNKNIVNNNRNSVVVKKVEEKKKQQGIKIQQKKLQQPPTLSFQQPKQQQQPTIQQKKAQLPPIQYSQLLVRYNHYKDKFPTQNNILHYKYIQQKYSFASVFKGNYLPQLRIYRDYKNLIQPVSSPSIALQYSWLIQQGKQYQITILQDEQQQNKHQRKVYIAPKQQQKCPMKKNKKVDQLTQEMRNMNIEELGSEKHKELLQQRALEEMLFS